MIKFGRHICSSYLVKTVGVMGDLEHLNTHALIRAVTSEDGMTASSFNFSNRFFPKYQIKLLMVFWY